MKRISILLLVLVVVATSFDVDARKRRTGRQSSSSAAQSTALPTNVTTTESELSYDAVSYFRRAQEGDACNFGLGGMEHHLGTIFVEQPLHAAGITDIRHLEEKPVPVFRIRVVQLELDVIYR